MTATITRINLPSHIITSVHVCVQRALEIYSQKIPSIQCSYY